MSENTFQACGWCRPDKGLVFMTWRAGSEDQRLAVERALKCRMRKISGGLRVAIDADAEGVIRWSGAKIHSTASSDGPPGALNPFTEERWDTSIAGAVVQSALIAHGLMVPNKANGGSGTVRRVCPY